MYASIWCFIWTWEYYNFAHIDEAPNANFVHLNINSIGFCSLEIAINGWSMCAKWSVLLEAEKWEQSSLACCICLMIFVSSIGKWSQCGLHIQNVILNSRGETKFQHDKMLRYSHQQHLRLVNGFVPFLVTLYMLHVHRFDSYFYFMYFIISLLWTLSLHHLVLCMRELRSMSKTITWERDSVPYQS